MPDSQSRSVRDRCHLTIVWWKIFLPREVKKDNGNEAENVQVPNEVIDVMESPEPTKRPSTPFPESPWTSRTRRRAVRRGGLRRWSSHRRATTRIFDPSLPNECAYQCLLRVAKMSVKSRNVKVLRARTAELIQEAFMKEETIAGLYVPFFIQESGMSLLNYVEAVSRSQWASVLEVACAAKVLEVDVSIKTPDAVVNIGEPSRNCIKLMGCHWTLHKVRSLCKSVVPGFMQIQRGGMQNTWDWEHELQIHQQPSQSAQPSSQHGPEVRTLPPPGLAEPGPEPQPCQREEAVALPAAQSKLEEEDEEIPDWAKVPSARPVGAVPAQPIFGALSTSPTPVSKSSSTSSPSAPSSDPSSSPMQPNTKGAQQPKVESKLEHIAKQQSVPMPAPSVSPQELSLGSTQTDSDILSKIVTVHIDPSVRTDVVSMRIMVQCSLTVGALIDRVTTMCGVDRRRTSLVLPATKQQLSIWNPVPNEVLLVDDWAAVATMYHMVNMFVSNAQYSCIIPADRNWDDRQFKQYISAITGSHISVMAITDLAGKPWVFPESYKTSSNIRVYTGVHRGGAKSVSLTPTEQYFGSESAQSHPHAEQPDSDPAYEQDRREIEQLEHELPSRRQSSSSRSRTPRRAMQFRQGVQHDDEPESDAEIWRNTWPQSPPAAQPDRIMKNVYYNDKMYGKMYAAPKATVSNILDDLLEKYKPLSPVEVYPMHAIHWDDVEYIKVELPPPSRVLSFKDLRVGRWEALQKIRHVPVLEDGLVVTHALFPWFLTLDAAQDRIEEGMFRDLKWKITAVDSANWVITSPDLPYHVKEDLQHYRLLRRIHEARGGMAPKKARVISLCPDPEGAKYVCDQAYTGAEQFVFHADSNTSVVAEKVCAIAADRKLDTDDVAVTTEFWLPRLEDMITIYGGHIFYVIAKPDLEAPELAERWSWEMYWLQAMLRQQRASANKIHPLREWKPSQSGPFPTSLRRTASRTIPSLETVKEKVETHHSQLPVAGNPVTFWPFIPAPSRGGMRRAKSSDPEVMQRQHMTAWALNKCQESCPELPVALSRTLLREWRLVNALNNTRSKAQVRHAVAAALRRSSLDLLASQMDQDLPGPREEPEAPVTAPVPAEDLTAHEQSNANEQGLTIPQTVQAMMPSLDQLRLELLWVQNTVTHTQAFLQHQAMMPRNVEVMTQVQNLTASQMEIAHIIESLKVTVSHLDRRMSLWETNYLPAIFERMEEISPTRQSDEESEAQHHSTSRSPRQDAQGQVQAASLSSDAVQAVAPQQDHAPSAPPQQEVSQDEQADAPPHHVGMATAAPTIIELLQQQSTRATAAIPAVEGSQRRALTPFSASR